MPANPGQPGPPPTGRPPVAANIAAETAIDLPLPGGADALGETAVDIAPPPGGGTGPEGGEAASGGILRSGAIMAVGTLVSRVTGFLRTAVIVAALGIGQLANAYNTANTIPNQVYDLLLGGILTSVIVPLLVRAKERDRAYGEQYEQRVFTLAVIGLAALTVVAVLAAPLFINVLAGSYTGDQRHIAVLFAEFFLPQIFFYGVGAFAGAILNTRGSFAAPMWAPILNNIVVIAIGGVFLALVSGKPSPGTITDTEFMVLAVGTTGGIVLQTVALWPSLRRVGFRWRPRLDFKRGEISQVGRMAGWTLMYVVATQIGLAVVTALANSAGDLGHKQHLGDSYGYTPYFNAYQLFQLPYAIVSVSVITALLPRMSRFAAEGKTADVRAAFSSGLRLSSVIIMPAAALMLVLGPEITTVLFAHGNTSSSDALVIARVMQMFAIALVPFSTYQLMLRVFYSFGDTRTPALVGVVSVTSNIVLAFAAYNVLGVKWIVVGIAGGYAITNIVGTLVCWLVLRRKLGGIDGRRIAGGHLKLLIAVWPLIGFAYAVHAVADAALGTDTLIPALAALIVGAGGGGLLYLVFAKLLRVDEVQQLIGTFARRLPGGHR
ncbi:murein biosynthesis integral membrane protein MurJ [Actinomadura opuntiae]|uniref:murein biosynthesis integral membrane protein MurJ n=1 Tax=Actinomadura sp. OS1-43 TaxID=604315 RepID=UPI00255B043B|nr:murein biosynthesis integral membrane protein MurJ [Actinomadura sp. OS1-43]MDL4816705.1 murein biosynthesis integral membrane protein MurJ [Actinomadura sp. OS1-43]